MDKTLKCSLLLATVTISSSPIAANSLEDFRVVMGLSAGYSEFSFPEKLDHDVGFTSVSIPVIVTTEKWQLSVNYQTNLSKADISEEEDVGQASRDDVDFTLGYKISNNWTAFGGYKYGNTEIDFMPRDFDEEDDELVNTFDSYKQSGPYLGVSYAWRFEKAGSLSLSIAYAQLSAENTFAANTDEEEEDDEELEFDDLTGKIDGDTEGFSYSLSWTMPLSSNLVFQTRFKINDYKQSLSFEGNRFNDIDESFSSLQVGVAYVF